MVAPVVEEPVLNSLTLRYLMACAEQPWLLRDSTSPALRRFAEKSPFYEEFVEKALTAVPSLTEGKLLETKGVVVQQGTWIPQRDFKRLLRVFKELSSIHNPLYYPELGRIIPTVQDSVTQLASMVAGPSFVITQSAGFNQHLNNDQKIVIEHKEPAEKRITARVQHYLLPSVEPHYMEMVTAALGYWEGIPRLWGWSEWGSTNLFEVQMSLDELVQRDYAYLDIELRQEGDIVFVNGKPVGKTIPLANDPERILGYKPDDNFLTRKPTDFSPVEILEDVVIENEPVFMMGVKYGMPANRYDISVPSPSVLKRIGYVARRLCGFNGKTEYQFLKKRPAQVALADAMRAHQRDVVAKMRAEVDAEKARADAAEARAEATKLRSDLDAQNREYLARHEATMKQVREKRSGAHDAKNNLLVAQPLAEKNLLLAINSHGMGSLSSTSKEAITLSDLSSYLERLTERMYADVKDTTGYSPYGVPDPVYDAAVVVREIERSQQNLKKIMREAEEAEKAAEIPKNKFTYRPLLEEVVALTLQMNQDSGTKVVNNIPPELEMYGNRDLLERALRNLLDNAVQASPNGTVEITAKIDRKRAADYLTTVVRQSGDINPEYARKLSRGEQVTSTKGERGNGLGANASYDIIVDKHGGVLRYSSLDEGKGSPWRAHSKFSIPLPE